MGKSKTKLLQEVIEILKNDGMSEAKIKENTDTMTKDELSAFIKEKKQNTSQSAPDPEATNESTTSSTAIASSPEPIAPKPSKGPKETGNFITSCNGCGLHVAGRLKSCPTPNCKGTIKILEV